MLYLFLEDQVQYAFAVNTMFPTVPTHLPGSLEFWGFLERL
jgi:hypothetical protein